MMEPTALRAFRIKSACRIAGHEIGEGDFCFLFRIVDDAQPVADCQRNKTDPGCGDGRKIVVLQAFAKPDAVAVLSGFGNSKITVVKQDGVGQLLPGKLLIRGQGERICFYLLRCGDQNEQSGKPMKFQKPTPQVIVVYAGPGGLPRLALISL